MRLKVKSLSMFKTKTKRIRLGKYNRESLFVALRTIKNNRIFDSKLSEFIKNLIRIKNAIASPKIPVKIK